MLYQKKKKKKKKRTMSRTEIHLTCPCVLSQMYHCTHVYVHVECACVRAVCVYVCVCGKCVCPCSRKIFCRTSWTQIDNSQAISFNVLMWQHNLRFIPRAELVSARSDRVKRGRTVENRIHRIFWTSWLLSL